MLDATFYLDTRELLKILCVFPVGSMEPEKSFSFKIWIHNWLCNSMLIDILGYLAVNTMHGSTILISKTSICNVSMSTPLHRMMTYSLFIYILFIRYLYILLFINFMILICDFSQNLNPTARCVLEVKILH